uniref:Sad1 and UNC84 domain containing 1 n=1 Tax=Oryzias latipes TaxID=8090 RepID=A0A3P9HK13_ORYLA
MDFSQLHTYTPPQCAPENTGYTYSLSSSYSTAALEFEKEHQIAPVYESPRMSRRSLRLQSGATHYGNEGLADHCHNQNSSYNSTSKEMRYSNYIVINYFCCRVFSSVGQSSAQKSNVNGKASASKSHMALSNGYICNNCSLHAQKTDACMSKLSCQAQEVSTEALSSTSSPFTSVYTRDRSRKNKTGEEAESGYNAHTFLSAFFLTSLYGSMKASKGLLWFLGKGWYQLVSLMSLLNIFFLTQCVPRLWKLLWLLLPFLLLLGEFLWLWGPSAATMFAYLPAINLTEWNLASAFSFSNFKTIPVSVPVTEPPMKRAPVAPVSQATVTITDARQLALLWERVKQEDEQQDQRHQDIFSLFSKLKEQLHMQTNRESLGVWVSSLLEERLGTLREKLEQENTQRKQNEEQQEQRQESQAARLAELELLLKALSGKTEVRKMDFLYLNTLIYVFRIAGVQQEDHDALLVEVQRLEAELVKIRQELQTVVGCKGKCEQLDSLQETVSSQVRRELQALFFGAGGSEDQQGEVPESLISWLSQRYVSTPDLQAALASLELSILKNISQQLELSRAQTLAEAESKTQNVLQTITGTVQHTSSSEGLTEEQVKLIVQNALKLFSQDRTGQVDYALESGGGSILSTRCSETYETKTALMSLFGLPLWYFSQSPRVVIQPDVYPGNCWAFKGSQGYLVIRLSLRILPTSFCLEHIPKSLSPTGNITSAPRNFTVFGLDDEYQDKGKLLGHYTYEENGEALQIFPVKEENDKTFQIIEVRVLSNWGHPEYTCLYRFRVHGEPRPE